VFCGDQGKSPKGILNQIYKRTSEKKGSMFGGRFVDGFRTQCWRDIVEFGGASPGGNCVNVGNLCPCL